MRRTRHAVIALALAVLAGGSLPPSAAALAVGQKAPDFTLEDSSGKKVTLSQLTAKGPVVVYTFIQAFTPT